VYCFDYKKTTSRKSPFGRFHLAFGGFIPSFAEERFFPRLVDGSSKRFQYYEYTPIHNGVNSVEREIYTSTEVCEYRYMANIEDGDQSKILDQQDYSNQLQNSELQPSELNTPENIYSRELHALAGIRYERGLRIDQYVSQHFSRDVERLRAYGYQGSEDIFEVLSFVKNHIYEGFFLQMLQPVLERLSKNGPDWDDPTPLPPSFYQEFHLIVCQISQMRQFRELFVQTSPRMRSLKEIEEQCTLASPEMMKDIISGLYHADMQFPALLNDSDFDARYLFYHASFFLYWLIYFDQKLRQFPQTASSQESSRSILDRISNLFKTLILESQRNAHQRSEIMRTVDVEKVLSPRPLDLGKTAQIEKMLRTLNPKTDTSQFAKKTNAEWSQQDMEKLWVAAHIHVEFAEFPYGNARVLYPAISQDAVKKLATRIRTRCMPELVLQQDWSIEDEAWFLSLVRSSILKLCKHANSSKENVECVYAGIHTLSFDVQSFLDESGIARDVRTTFFVGKSWHKPEYKDIVEHLARDFPWIVLGAKQSESQPASVFHDGTRYAPESHKRESLFLHHFLQSMELGDPEQNIENVLKPLNELYLASFKSGFPVQMWWLWERYKTDSSFLREQAKKIANQKPHESRVDQWSMYDAV